MGLLDYKQDYDNLKNIYHLFYVLLLEQNTGQKTQVLEKQELKVKLSNHMEYKIETI